MFEEAIKKIGAALKRRKIAYMIIGGQAVSSNKKCPDGDQKQWAHFLLKPLVENGLIKRAGGHKTGKYTLV